MTLRATLAPPPVDSTGRFTFNVECGRCHKKFTMTTESQDFRYWQNDGMNVQVAFPYLNPRYQELLTDGVCSECTDVALASEAEDQNR